MRMPLCLSHIWRIVWTALLAVAVASAWSSGSMAASPLVMHAHAQAGIHASHAREAANVDAGHAHHSTTTTAQTDLAKKSDPAGLACCVMTTCHPAVPVLPIEIAHVPSSGPPASGPFPRPDGNEPSPVLPPPRSSQV